MPHTKQAQTAINRHIQSPTGKGIKINRLFTRPNVHPYDEITWEKREATITNANGEVVFSQSNVEAPSFWSQQATNIVVSKYFRGQIGTSKRETSVKQMITRVAKTISDWGRKDGYFATKEDGDIFEAELTHILIYQKAAFNSPVWFNVGVKEKPQCSACFILSVKDDMESILSWISKEGMIFKGGSGSGVNLSKLRGSKEKLSLGGSASGPVSFMRGADSSAGAIKSGGTTRRAAKMVILDIDHPDIEEFINSKSKEEQKAWALGEAGYDMSLNGDAWSSIQFQNANNSVRVTDDFMRAVEEDGEWNTITRIDGKINQTFKARDLMTQIAQATWICGDPGIQFDTAVNDWHTCLKSDRIYASNPCSEFMFLDDTACNLASINLMRHRTIEKEFDTDAFKHTAEIVITAMEIIIDNSSYPTSQIAKNSHDFRPLGIGYANLGALLMSRGVAYDSDEGRSFAAAITSLLSGTAYAQSTKIARVLGPFAKYKLNEKSTLRVLKKHRKATEKMSEKGVSKNLIDTAMTSWKETIELAEKYGVRNAQISLLAPTGTIAFLMDCDTTGIEPDIALVKYKWLVGGGMMKIVNTTIPEALERLGYGEKEREEILAYLDKHDTVEGAPHLNDEHLSVFDCAFSPQNGKRFIHHLAHIKMTGATQPFLSGAISKTVNMSKNSTPEDIIETYTMAWKLGLKAIAIYRDGSKRTQPLTIKANEENGDEKEEKEEIKKTTDTQMNSPSENPIRYRLPDERPAITHKFSINGHEGYITVGLYDDGQLGEIFIVMAKEGSVISGLMDAFATSISIGLQYGVPLRTLVKKFTHCRFEPSGFTNNPQIKIAKSVVDYIFRWLAIKFLPEEELAAIGINGFSKDENSNYKSLTIASPTKDNEGGKQQKEPEEPSDINVTVTFNAQEDAPPCDTCGSIMVRNGACYKCLNCGATSGCS